MDALEQNRLATDAVQSAANHLYSLILDHEPKLVPEATIVRECATLLQHLEQNFRRLTEARHRWISTGAISMTNQD